ncbi:MAG: hypothetical protein M1817_004310 [Caeruleum heppii]|nr:MAG: hypothetical protein M1817_004310 [Caeruleum heppii]
MDDPTTQTPCPACGWTARRQRCCGYASHVKLFYGAGTRGAWEIGSDYILKERPDGPPRNEPSSIAFLKAHSTIPLPTIAKHWVDHRGRAFTLIERVPGQTLEAAWPTLSTEKRARIARETGEYLNQLRRFQRPCFESVDGGPVHHGLLFGGDPSTPHGPFSTDDDFWKDLAVRVEKLPEKAKARMRERLPAGAPYTLTHGDLTSCNIIVDADAGHLAAIIDWEHAGYFPVWWEFACAGLGLGDEDADWKELLREHLVSFPAQREFWRDFWSLCMYPDLNERGEAVLAKLMAD